MTSQRFPNASDLRYFMEVARTQKLSQAARNIGIAQPSLTQAMQRLEDVMDVTLFIRGKKGVTLTPAGQALYQHAQNLMQQWTQVRDSAHASMHRTEGVFTLGCHAAVARSACAYFMPQLLADHPNLSITFHHDISRVIADAVINLDVDLGIVVNPVRHPDLIIKPLASDYITLWANQSTDHKTLIDPQSDEMVLICDPSLLQSQSIIKQLHNSAIQIGRVIETSDLLVVSELTAAGCGIGIMPHSTAQKARTPLTQITDVPSYDDEHCLIYRVENKNIHALQVIADAICAYYKT